jgi:hypothetical protein
MPFETRTRINFHGNSGWLITTASLRPLSEAKWDDIPPEILARSRGTKTFGDWVDEGVEGTSLVDPLTQTRQYIAYRDIINADGSGVDLHTVFLNVSFRMEIDPGGRPLYPSDLADDMRRNGITEDRIQALIEWERGMHSHTPEGE